MPICEYCGKEHDGSYGSGRFCSAKCARRYSYQYIDEDAKARQIKALLDPVNRQKTAETRKRKTEERIKLELDKSKEPKSTMRDNCLSTLTLGKIGELKTIEKFIKRDIQVYLPVVDNNGVDMIADVNGELIKIQVKSSARSNDEKCEFNLRSCNTRYKKNGEQCGRIKTYDSEEIDYFSLYDYNNDEVYLVKNPELKTAITIRSTPPKNNQIDKIHYKEDCKFDRMLDIICSGIDPDDVIETDYDVIDYE